MNDTQQFPPILAIGEKSGAFHQLVQSLLGEQLSVIHAYTSTEAEKHARGHNALIVAEFDFLEAHHLQWTSMTDRCSDAVWLFILPSGREDLVPELLKLPTVFYALKSPWSEAEVRALILRALERSEFLQRQQALQQQVEELQEHLTSNKNSLSETRALGQVVHSEKMVILGQMVAGIAHEINTPSGAINAAVVNMSHHLKELMQSIEEFEGAGMERQDAGKITQVVGEMLTALNEGQRKSSGEIRKEQKRLMDLLDRQHIKNSRQVAKDIARMGLAGYTDVLLDLSAVYETDRLFTFLTHCSRIITSTRDIQLSIDMLTRIVHALKSYSYPKSETLELVNIHEGLDIAVILLHNKFKHQIQVETRWGNLPDIWCYPGDLSHVWINIINNAIQAIEGDGRIDIETFHTADHVGVKISDTGQGIPADIQSRIFDIDFTTKTRDKGTGLGLYIARQIVEKHHGSISVESIPGQTRFEVLLPIKPAG